MAAFRMKNIPLALEEERAVAHRSLAQELMLLLLPPPSWARACLAQHATHPRLP